MLTLSLFKDKNPGHVIVFPGKLDKLPDPSQGIYPLYGIQHAKKELKIWHLWQPGQTPFYEVHISDSCSPTTIAGSGQTIEAERTGLTSDSWKFEFDGTKYKWKISMSNSKWYLRDECGHEVAHFKRKKKLGVLDINIECREHLQVLVVLTCVMVYNAVTKTEEHAGAAGEVISAVTSIATAGV
ncbi:hypothetical protein IWW54_000734 [Coemansia sp. RSA 2705]|nr:hypothetical protein IWW54_000734 [Coemansia sp. RSA 2705]